MRNESGLEELWKRRSSAFRKEIAPYIRYMGQSGFPSFVSLLLIVSAVGYIGLLRGLPDDFPVVPAGVAALTPALCWSPLRTWLAPADIVYLMPREARMGAYLRLSARYSAAVSAVPAVIVLILYLPIYAQRPGYASAWTLLLVSAALKAANGLAAWRERQMAWGTFRTACRAVRWLLTASVLTAWLVLPVWQAASFLVLCAALIFFLYRLSPRQRLPWERLIREETSARRNYYRFFSMFIDVPSFPPVIRRRPYLSWLLRRIRLARSNTYVYLFGATLIRTEVSGILIRIALLGAYIVYWSGDSAAWNGWGAAAAYGLFAAVYGAQAGSLRQAHRHSVWKHVYPLPEQEMTEQLLRVDRAAMAAGLVALALPLTASLLPHGLYAPLAVTLALAAVYAAAVRPRRLRRKLLAEERED